MQAGVIILLDVLISEVIDEDEMRSGARREGTYYGVQGFIVRFGISRQGFLISLVQVYTGYLAGRVNQLPQVIAGMRDLLSLIPFLSIVIALFCLWRYPLVGERLAQVARFRAEREKSPLAE